MGKLWKKMVNYVKMYVFFFVLNYRELEVDSLDFAFGIVARLLSYAGISILLSTFSFFTVGNADVANFTMQIKEIAKYPITIYPKVLQIVFTFVFPVAFVAFLPMRMIMGEIGVFWIAALPVVSGVFYWFSKKVWMLDLRHYGSSGT
ncbi:MAG: ABC transporter permease [Lachnospiraceae bacterium]|nr:ABC transporter permease [Lachnospiraceae bacterium]